MRQKKEDVNVMPIAGFFGPYPHEHEGFPDYFTNDIFRKIADAGINLMVYSAADYAYNPELIEKNLGFGEKYGVGIFVTDSNVIDKRQQAEITVEEVVKEIKNYSEHPAFCGMYVVDEPQAAYYCMDKGDKMISTYKRISEIIQHELNTPGYINLLPIVNHNVLAMMRADIAGVDSFIGNELLIQLSFEYGAGNDDGEATLQLGVNINGSLYQNKKFSIADCYLKAVGSHLAIYREIDGSGIIVDNLMALTEEIYQDGFDIITLKEFVDDDGCPMPCGRYEGSVKDCGNDYHVKDLENFHKKLLSFKVTFEGGGYQHSIIFGGKKEWSGFNLHPSVDGKYLFIDCTWAEEMYDKSKIQPECRAYYEQYVNEMCDTLHPPILSWDHYPFDNERKGKMEYYFYNMDLIRRTAEERDIPFWAFVQAGSQWNDHWKCFDVIKPYYPNEFQFRWNVNTSLAFGAKGIQYFPLVQPYQFTMTKDGNYECNGIIGAMGNTTQWYCYAQTINQHIKAIDEVLMNSIHKGVIASGEPAKKNLQFATCVIESGRFEQLQYVMGDALVGCFDYQGKTALYVVNHSYEHTQTIKLRLDGVQKLQVIQNANKSDVSSSDLTLEMAAGEGILIVIQ